MLAYAVTLLLASAPTSAQAQAGPRLHEDGRVTFSYSAAGAERVLLVVEGEAPVEMSRGDDGTWRHTTMPLSPDLYLYYFVLDGRPASDPANPEGVPMVSGGRQSLVHVPGPDSLLWERSDAPPGRIDRHAYPSQRFGEPRALLVYTPPGYEAAPDHQYPVLYLLHGVLNDERAWSTAGRVDVILNNLFARGHLTPMLVVMPLGYGFSDAPSRVGEMFSPATDQAAVLHAFARSLIEEVVPFVERAYRVRRGAEARAVAGLSMGGSQALYLGLNHPDLFGAVASFGGALIMYGGRYDLLFPLIGDRSSWSPPAFLTLSVGTEDFLLGVNRQFTTWLVDQGLDVSLDEVPGGHTWSTWRREFIRLAPKLFR